MAHSPSTRPIPPRLDPFRRLGRRALVLLAGSAVVAASGGCGATPRTTMGDPMVFTAEDLYWASANPDFPSFAGLMQGHFGEKASAYETNKTRMDHMLDGQQRASTYLQTAETSLVLTLALNQALGEDEGSGKGKAGDSDSAGSDPPEGSKAPGASSSSNVTVVQPAAPQPAATPATNPAPTTPKTTTTPAKDKPKPQAPADKKKTTDASKDEPKKDADPLKTAQADLIKSVNENLNKALTAGPADSPFDRLDRAADFFRAYGIKQLQRYGDSRIINRTELRKLLALQAVGTTNAAGIVPPPFQLTTTAGTQGEITLDLLSDTFFTENPKTHRLELKAALSGPARDIGLRPPTHRMIMLLAQAHVDDGTKPNYVTGIRVTVNAVRPGQADSSVLNSGDDVLIVRLHPTRSYDLEQVDFGESFTSSLKFDLAGGFTISGVPGEGSLARQASQQAAARRQFLARIGKYASAADATDNTFGWTFFPSNLQIQPVSALRKTVDWLVGTPKAYEVKAYLEAGGRDVMVYLLVPVETTALTLTHTSFCRDLGGVYPDTETPGQPQTVTLPPYSPEEMLSTLHLVTPVAKPKPEDNGSEDPIDPAQDDPSRDDGAPGPIERTPESDAIQQGGGFPIF